MSTNKPSPDAWLRKPRHVAQSRYFRGENHDVRWNAHELDVRVPRVPRPHDVIIEGDRADRPLVRDTDRTPRVRDTVIERAVKVRKLNKRRAQRRFKAKMREQDITLD